MKRLSLTSAWAQHRGEQKRGQQKPSTVSREIRKDEELAEAPEIQVLQTQHVSVCQSSKFNRVNYATQKAKDLLVTEIVVQTMPESRSSRTGSMQ